MSETAERLMAELVRLPAQERAEIADRLVESLHQESENAADETAFEAELDRRLREIKSGQDVGEPAEQVFAELRRKYS